MKLRKGASEAGKIGHLEVEIRLRPLLERRLVLERAIIRDLDVAATRNPQNGLASMASASISG